MSKYANASKKSKSYTRFNKNLGVINGRGDSRDGQESLIWELAKSPSTPNKVIAEYLQTLSPQDLRKAGKTIQQIRGNRYLEHLYHRAKLSKDIYYHHTDTTVAKTLGISGQLHEPHQYHKMDTNGTPLQHESSSDSVFSELGHVTVQPKLKIGMPSDNYELEADRLARDILSPGPSSQRHVKTNIMPVSGNSGMKADPNISKKILDTRGSGIPLPRNILSKIEARLGDLSDVRLHTDAESGSIAEDLGASAFTVGKDIYMGPGKFDPTSPEGQGLIAHELVHTAQQATGAEQIQMCRKCGYNGCSSKTDECSVHKVLEVFAFVITEGDYTGLPSNITRHIGEVLYKVRTDPNLRQYIYDHNLIDKKSGRVRKKIKPEVYQGFVNICGEIKDAIQIVDNAYHHGHYPPGTTAPTTTTTTTTTTAIPTESPAQLNDEVPEIFRPAAGSIHGMSPVFVSSMSKIMQLAPTMLDSLWRFGSATDRISTIIPRINAERTSHYAGLTSSGLRSMSGAAKMISGAGDVFSKYSTKGTRIGGAINTFSGITDLGAGVTGVLNKLHVGGPRINTAGTSLNVAGGVFDTIGGLYGLIRNAKNGSKLKAALGGLNALGGLATTAGSVLSLIPGAGVAANLASNSLWSIGQGTQAIMKLCDYATSSDETPTRRTPFVTAHLPKDQGIHSACGTTTTTERHDIKHFEASEAELKDQQNEFVSRVLVEFIVDSYNNPDFTPHMCHALTFGPPLHLQYAAQRLDTEGFIRRLVDESIVKLETNVAKIIAQDPEDFQRVSWAISADAHIKMFVDMIKEFYFTSPQSYRTYLLNFRRKNCYSESEVKRARSLIPPEYLQTYDNLFE